MNAITTHYTMLVTFLVAILLQSVLPRYVTASTSDSISSSSNNNRVGTIFQSVSLQEQQYREVKLLPNFHTTAKNRQLDDKYTSTDNIKVDPKFQKFHDIEELFLEVHPDTSIVEESKTEEDKIPSEDVLFTAKQDVVTTAVPSFAPILSAPVTSVPAGTSAPVTTTAAPVGTSIPITSVPITSLSTMPTSKIGIPTSKPTKDDRDSSNIMKIKFPHPKDKKSSSSSSSSSSTDDESSDDETITIIADTYKKTERKRQKKEKKSKKKKKIVDDAGHGDEMMKTTAAEINDTSDDNTSETKTTTLDNTKGNTQGNDNAETKSKTTDKDKHKMDDSSSIQGNDESVITGAEVARQLPVAAFKYELVSGVASVVTELDYAVLANVTQLAFDTLFSTFFRNNPDVDYLMTDIRQFDVLEPLLVTYDVVVLFGPNSMSIPSVEQLSVVASDGFGVDGNGQKELFDILSKISSTVFTTMVSFKYSNNVYDLRSGSKEDSSSSHGVEGGAETSTTSPPPPPPPQVTGEGTDPQSKSTGGNSSHIKVFVPIASLAVLYVILAVAFIRNKRSIDDPAEENHEIVKNASKNMYDVENGSVQNTEISDYRTNVFGTNETLNHPADHDMEVTIRKVPSSPDLSPTAVQSSDSEDMVDISLGPSSASSSSSDDDVDDDTTNVSQLTGCTDFFHDTKSSFVGASADSQDVATRTNNNKNYIKKWSAPLSHRGVHKVSAPATIDEDENENENSETSTDLDISEKEKGTVSESKVLDIPIPACVAFTTVPTAVEQSNSIEKESAVSVLNSVKPSDIKLKAKMEKAKDEKVVAKVGSNNAGGSQSTLSATKSIVPTVPIKKTVTTWSKSDEVSKRKNLIVSVKPMEVPNSAVQRCISPLSKRSDEQEIVNQETDRKPEWISKKLRPLPEPKVESETVAWLAKKFEKPVEVKKVEKVIKIAPPKKSDTSSVKQPEWVAKPLRSTGIDLQPEKPVVPAKKVVPSVQKATVPNKHSGDLVAELKAVQQRRANMVSSNTESSIISESDQKSALRSDTATVQVGTMKELLSANPVTDFLSSSTAVKSNMIKKIDMQKRGFALENLLKAKVMKEKEVINETSAADERASTIEIDCGDKDVAVASSNEAAVSTTTQPEKLESNQEKLVYEATSKPTEILPATNVAPLTDTASDTKLEASKEIPSWMKKIPPSISAQLPSQLGVVRTNVPEDYGIIKQTLSDNEGRWSSSSYATQTPDQSSIVSSPPNSSYSNYNNVTVSAPSSGNGQQYNSNKLISPPESGNNQYTLLVSPPSSGNSQYAKLKPLSSPQSSGNGNSVSAEVPEWMKKFKEMGAKTADNNPKIE